MTTDARTPAQEGRPVYGIYHGIIQDAADSDRMGRIAVYIPEFKGPPQLKSSWTYVDYMSPFAGSTSEFETDDVKSFDSTKKSYGMWMVPPTKGTLVIIGFLGGDINHGVLMGCLYHQEKNFTVPGIPSADNYDGIGPAAERNINDSQNVLRPQHDPMVNALKTQGLTSDAIRGTTTSGARRESPSRVFGILTPGQHQFVMDDGNSEGTDSMIRLRTRNGAQIMINDEHGMIYIISRDGYNWVELNNDGKIDVYAKGSISMHSNEDINIHADNNVNIHGGNGVNILSQGKDGIKINAMAGKFELYSKQDYTLESDLNGNIKTMGQFAVQAARLDLNSGSVQPAKKLKLKNLTGNTTTATSICPRVPEEEPWDNHSSKNVAIDPGAEHNEDIGATYS
jgi:phage gp45-like